MTQAFKCFKCERLCEDGKQTFRVKYGDYSSVAQVEVARAIDLCPKCVIWALEETLKQAKE